MEKSKENRFEHLNVGTVS